MLFKDFMGNTHDLRNPATYKDFEWHDWPVHKLREECIKELGYALFYTQFIHPGPHYDDQKKRINGYCRLFAEKSAEHREENPKNMMWHKSFLYRFLDEIENLC